MLLSREDLPLSSIDFVVPHGGLHPSRFFESHVKILELEERMAEKASVLIAQPEDSQTLYAIERNNRKLYTVCKLGSWVSITELATKATVSLPGVLYPNAPQPSDDQIEPLAKPRAQAQPKEKRLAIEALQSAVRKRVRSQSVVSGLEDPAVVDKHRRSDDDIGPPPDAEPPRSEGPPETLPTVIPPEAVGLTSAAGTSGDHSTHPEATRESIFDNIRSHYVDVLYRSKVRTLLQFLWP